MSWTKNGSRMSGRSLKCRAEGEAPQEPPRQGAAFIPEEAITIADDIEITKNPKSPLNESALSTS